MKAITLRLPASLHDYLTQHLHESNRSLNYEIVVRLQASIEFERLLKLGDPDEIAAALDRNRRRFIDLRLSGGDK